MANVWRAGLLFLCACSGSGSAGSFSGTEPSDDGGASDAGSSPSTPEDDSGSGSPGVFTNNDAAPAGVVFDCKPGTYAGMFTTTVTNDAGGLFSLFTFNWSGNLSIVLQGKVENNGSGEVPVPTLTIAPGAKLAGMDTMGGHFSADLSGQLDCPTKTLTATISNGFYSYLGDAGGVQMTGDMSATYDDSSNPPKLSGQMNVGSPQVPGTGGVGTWTATLQ
jgi:hypothetical protein